MARVYWYVQVYIHMYIYKITYCWLLAVDPVMDMIEQMVGVLCYHDNKMGYTTTRSPILFVEVKETQISLEVLTITDVVKVFSDKITAILSVILYHNTGNNICFLSFQMDEKQNWLMSIFGYPMDSWVHTGTLVFLSLRARESEGGDLRKVTLQDRVWSQYWAYVYIYVTCETCH